jgi:selenocysteine lyase/cysteine desulfurase
MIHRRNFLNRAAFGVAATSLSGLACTRPARTPLPASARDGARAGAAPDATEAPIAVNSTSTWSEIRSQFLLTPNYIHLTAMLLASHPAPVRRAIERHRRALDENPALYTEEGMRFIALEQDVRTSAARYLDTNPDWIALTDSTSMGLGLSYCGLQLSASDDVLTTTHDHYASQESLRYATERAGASLRKVALYENSHEATAAGMVAALTGAIRPETRVVAVTWVHSSTGVKTPVRAMGEAVAAMNARRAPADQILFCVDAVHGFGVEDATVADLACDLLAAGCHKWLFGPRGTGIVWANERAWQRLTPVIPPFHGAPYMAWMRGERPAGVPAGIMMTPGGFHSFEHRWALSEAFEFHMAIGKARIQARTHELNTQLKRGLAEMRHVRLHTPMDPALSSGIVCFDVDGMTPEQVVAALLEKRIVASATPYARSHARLTPSIYNDPGDIDAALAAVRALA